ncbi:TNFAIP3-interacting protein 1 isoform X2 [Protopterus annectens]|uniref:TNFAIP3-interacting protein 1 isoform X2 n=1 Tax=Protopterus annectens TaxID=7888 RepID=UPI001CFA9CC1|nr:TNFAIP3-interacting protein 1 isoform X2 [Protopterus annectens]
MDSAAQQQKEEHTVLSEKLEETSLGHLLDVSKAEALKLRLRVVELTKDNEALRGLKLPSADRSESEQTDVQGAAYPESSRATGEEQNEHLLSFHTEPKPQSSGSSSEFEVVSPVEQKKSDGKKMDFAQELQNEDINLSLHLQRLENIMGMFAKESDTSQLLSPLGMMILEFSRLSNKVQKIEHRTAILQTLCEQLRKENEDLRKKLESDIEQRNLVVEKLRQENVELKKILTTDTKEKPVLEGGDLQQNTRVTEKVQLTRNKAATDMYERKIKELEHQRVELLEVNKQWDRQFRAAKQLYEQKITELRQRLAESQKVVSELEAEREQKQRDFDRKLLLAKSKIENEEGEKEKMVLEVNELKQKVKFLQDQIGPLSKQRDYQEKEILRLNKALERALHVQPSAPQTPVFGNLEDTGMAARRQDLLTQIEVLSQQVKIFEEDFQKERSDRERMHEEKEELKKELKKMQSKISVMNTQGPEERMPIEPHPGPVCPPYQPLSPPVLLPMYHGYEDWPVRYPPSAMPDTRVQNRNFMNLPPPEYPWHPQFPPATNLPLQGVDSSRQINKEQEPVAPGIGKTQR